MSRYFIPLVAALLLSSCCCPKGKKSCPNRYCPPAAQRCCPEPAATPRCSSPKKTHTRRVGPNRQPMSLSRALDYLPGLPPSYLSI